MGWHSNEISQSIRQRNWFNYEDRILHSIRSVETLIKARDSSLSPGEELSQGRKIMRELGLILERKDDVIEAISRLTEKSLLYQRKLDTQEKRKEFTRTNMKYELQRSRFYRDLSGDERVLVDIEEDKVRNFWDTMWNSAECEQKDYSDYLREYIPDETSSVDYFPSIVEFSEIIKFLPTVIVTIYDCWKR